MNEGSVIVHDSFQIVRAIREHPVQLAWENSGVSRNYRFTLSVQSNKQE